MTIAHCCIPVCKLNFLKVATIHNFIFHPLTHMVFWHNLTKPVLWALSTRSLTKTCLPKHIYEIILQLCGFNQILSKLVVWLSEWTNNCIWQWANKSWVTECEWEISEWLSRESVSGVLWVNDCFWGERVSGWMWELGVIGWCES